MQASSRLTGAEGHLNMHLLLMCVMDEDDDKLMPMCNCYAGEKKTLNVVKHHLMWQQLLSAAGIDPSKYQ